MKRSIICFLLFLFVGGLSSSGALEGLCKIILRPTLKSNCTSEYNFYLVLYTLVNINLNGTFIISV